MLKENKKEQIKVVADGNQYKYTNGDVMATFPATKLGYGKALEFAMKWPYAIRPCIVVPPKLSKKLWME